MLLSLEYNKFIICFTKCTNKSCKVREGNQAKKKIRISQIKGKIF